MKDDASLTPAFQKKDDTGKILGDWLHIWPVAKPKVAS